EEAGIGRAPLQIERCLGRAHIRLGIDPEVFPGARNRQGRRSMDRVLSVRGDLHRERAAGRVPKLIVRALAVSQVLDELAGGPWVVVVADEVRVDRLAL